MKVYRLELAHKRGNGPFGNNEDPLGDIFGRTLSSEPAYAAQVAAKLEGVKGPYDMPGITKDGIDPVKAERLGRQADLKGHRVVFGFASMDQYHDWFRTPLTRKALFLHVSRGYNDTRRYNDLELRCFEVPDEDVLLAEHQVVFTLEAATEDHLVSRKEAML